MAASLLLLVTYPVGEGCVGSVTKERNSFGIPGKATVGPTGYLTIALK